MEEKLILCLTFNPGLALTGFRTSRPWFQLKISDGLKEKRYFFSSVRSVGLPELVLPKQSVSCNAIRAKLTKNLTCQQAHF